MGVSASMELTRVGSASVNFVGQRLNENPQDLQITRAQWEKLGKPVDITVTVERREG